MQNIIQGQIADLLNEYVIRINEIYGSHVSKVILYGSYARGDFRVDSDIDVMILLNISDGDAKQFQCDLSDMTYDFNMDNDVDIKPIAQSVATFDKWVEAYPFFKNIDREGVVLYGAA